MIMVEFLIIAAWCKCTTPRGGQVWFFESIVIFIRVKTFVKKTEKVRQGKNVSLLLLLSLLLLSLWLLLWLLWLWLWLWLWL